MIMDQRTLLLWGYHIPNFNNRIPLDMIFEKLDKVVANKQWLNLRKDARVENLPIKVLDHGHILQVVDFPTLVGKQNSFKFEAKWLLGKSSLTVVHQIWKKYIKGSYAYQLVRKIKFLKKEIKNWKKFIVILLVIDLLKHNLVWKTIS